MKVFVAWFVLWLFTTLGLTVFFDSYRTKFHEVFIGILLLEVVAVVMVAAITLAMWAFAVVAA